MKIIFCGPPHSGKSVFIANLIDKLPSDAYTIIRACLEGKEEIYSREPFLYGKVVGLERGQLLKDSSIIEAMVSDIVKKSKYAEHSDIEPKGLAGVMIDDTELGFELGYGKEILTEDGTPIKKVRWRLLKKCLRKTTISPKDYIHNLKISYISLLLIKNFYNINEFSIFIPEFITHK